MIDGHGLMIMEMRKAHDRDKLYRCWAGENGFDLTWHRIYRTTEEYKHLPPRSLGDSPFER